MGKHGPAGIVAKENIPPRFGLMAIPNKILITYERVKKSPDLAKYIKANPALTDSGKEELNGLILFLIPEILRGEKSFWFPYLNLISSMNAIWSEEDILAVDPAKEYLYLQASNEKAGKQESFRLFQKIFSTLTKNQFDLAWFIANSRAIKTKNGLAVVPGADFLVQTFDDHANVEEHWLHTLYENPLKKGVFGWNYREIKARTNLTELFPTEKSFAVAIKKPTESVLRDPVDENSFWTYSYDTDNEPDEESQDECSDEDSDGEKEEEEEDLDSDEEAKENEKVKDELTKVTGMPPELKDYITSNLSKAELKVMRKLENEKQANIRQAAGEDDSWYKPLDDNIYYIISSGNEKLPKHKPLAVYYGRYSNEVFLKNCGYSHNGNVYDFISCRIWTGAKDRKDSPTFLKDMIFTRWLTNKESKKIHTSINAKDLVRTKELRGPFKIRANNFPGGKLRI